MGVERSSRDRAAAAGGGPDAGRMRAAVTTRYGPPEVVEIRSIPRPVPRAGALLVRVNASAVTAGDARIRALDAPAGYGLPMRAAFGLARPRRPVLGREFAGEVAELGQGAAGFAPGARVFGITAGIALGAHAEHLTVAANGLVLPQPEGLEDAEAAAFFFGGLTAATFLIDKAGLGAGERLLVNGATGAVGSAALQIGRSIGARVTAVCSGANADFARTLGAEAVIDYRTEPLTGAWDVVLDVAGTLPYPAARPLLADGGRLLVVTGTLARDLGAALRRRRGPHRVHAGLVAETRPAMERLVGLWRTGAYRPQVGAVFPLDAIREAHALAGSRHKRGNVVVAMGAG